MYVRNPQMPAPLLQATEDACGDIAADAFHSWIRHARKYFPHCLARENVACDVDEVLWPEGKMQYNFFCFLVVFFFLLQLHIVNSSVVLYLEHCICNFVLVGTYTDVYIVVV